MRSYDDTQRRHYDSVAREQGSNSASTMPDRIVRETESRSIVSAVSSWLERADGTEASIKIADLGCGNGTTLSVLRDSFPSSQVFGVEYNEELLRIAQKVPGVKVVWGDLVESATLPDEEYDVVVLNRVFHTIMSGIAQVSALKNVVSLIKPGGLLIAIEAFETGLQFMNEARHEFNLPAVKMPHHNLFLPEDFFQGMELLERVDLGIPEYFLSTHYYLSYVLYPALATATGGEFNRNSTFVRLLSQMLPNVGDFGSNRFCTFTRSC